MLTEEGAFLLIRVGICRQASPLCPRRVMVNWYGRNEQRCENEPVISLQEPPYFAMVVLKKELSKVYPADRPCNYAGWRAGWYGTL